MKNIFFVFILLYSCAQHDKPNKSPSPKWEKVQIDPIVFKSRTDSLSILRLSEWEPSNSWFGDDTVYLKPILEMDTIKFDTPEKAILVYKRGHRISFPDTGKLKHQYNVSCIVGGYYPTLEEFELINGKVHVKFKKTYWKGEPVIRRELIYDIQSWNENLITLSR